jgi:hypothetical protein
MVHERSQGQALLFFQVLGIHPYPHDITTDSHLREMVENVHRKGGSACSSTWHQGSAPSTAATSHHAPQINVSVRAERHLGPPLG